MFLSVNEHIGRDLDAKLNLCTEVEAKYGLDRMINARITSECYFYISMYCITISVNALSNCLGEICQVVAHWNCLFSCYMNDVSDRR